MLKPLARASTRKRKENLVEDDSKPAQSPVDLTEDTKQDIFKRIANGQTVGCPIEGCGQRLLYGTVKYGGFSLMAGVCPVHGNVTGGRVS